MPVAIAHGGQKRPYLHPNQHDKENTGDLLNLLRGEDIHRTGQRQEHPQRRNHAQKFTYHRPRTPLHPKQVVAAHHGLARHHVYLYFRRPHLQPQHHHYRVESHPAQLPGSVST